ncbi:MAG: hypothetical protein Q9208_004182 [Pyrenodesmia sp. 3 TL-2023]
MQTSNTRPENELKALEEGLASTQDAHKTFEMTTVQTGSTAVATSPRVSSSKTVSGLDLFTRLHLCLKALPITWSHIRRRDLRIDGAMGLTAIPKLEEYPTGFPRLSCFLDSDDSFMVYKRFGIVFSRLLLNKQDEIREMEATLHAMDKTDDATDGSKYLMARDHRDSEAIPQEWSETRSQLLRTLERKILEYSELLLKAHRVKSLEKPTKRDYRSVLRYMEKDGGQLFEGEMSWIYDKEDLVTLRPGREHAWLDGILERLLNICRGKIVRYIFCTPETRARTDDKAIHYYDRRRISKCVTMIITILILVLLMVPIWLLYHAAVHGTIGKTTDTIVLILAFTLIFSATVSAFTKAKRHEIVAASAG